MESESSWVLDSLVGFLQGPIWNIPIISFIEQRSIVFEPDDGREVDRESDQQPIKEREEEYRKIFQEYGDLVDRLLSAHMEDLHISLEQFEAACRDAKGSLGAKFQRTLFEQIWAANDYEIFRAMMVKRNIELHIQAMKILTTSLTNSLSKEGSEEALSFLVDDDALLEQVMKLSLEDAKEEQDSLDEKVKEDVIRIALEEKDRLETERDKEQEKLNKALEKAMNSVDDEVDGGQGDGNSVGKDNQSESKHGSDRGEDEEEHTDDNFDEDDVRVSLLKSKRPEIDPEEIRARQDYLRRRRDKIIETKRKERQRQVAELEEIEIKEKRPKSAKAVRSSVLSGNNGSEKNDKVLNFRRSLAAKLKAEVIEKK